MLLVVKTSRIFKRLEFIKSVWIHVIIDGTILRVIHHLHGRYNSKKTVALIQHAEIELAIKS